MWAEGEGVGVGEGGGGGGGEGEGEGESHLHPSDQKAKVGRASLRKHRQMGRVELLGLGTTLGQLRRRDRHLR